MSTGPSKEELENYWQTSRQYFDELAKYYQQADPPYYKKYILPYYNNPFKVSGKSSGSRAGITITAIFGLLMVFLGAGLFFLIRSPGGNERTKDEKSIVEQTADEQSTADQRTGSSDSTVTSPDTRNKEQVTTGMDTSFHFKKGIEMYHKKNYRAAERLLKGVPESDPFYDEAKKILNEIEAESLTQKNKDKKKTRRNDSERYKTTETDVPRTVRPKAKERIR